MLYTIVIEFNEDTFAIQHEANSPADAIRDGISSRVYGGIRIFNDSQISELVQEIEKEISGSCVAISGLCNVWVDTFLIQNELVQIHAIATCETI